MGSECGETFWQVHRDQIVCDPEVVYLNTGSYGLLPRCVYEAYMRDREAMSREPVRFLWREFPERHWRVRQRLARFLNVEPRHLIFTINVTAALNIVGLGLREKLRGPIVVTDQEYGAMMFLWREVANRHGVELRVVELPRGDGVEQGAVIERVAEALEGAALLAVSHVTYMSGMRLPVQELCGLARERGVLTVIDGAHAPGMFPLDLSALDADFYAGNCHKWLLAPISAGFLWVHPRVESLIQPVVVSWGWEYEPATRHERNEYGSTPWLRSFEFQGTRDVCAWLAVERAIEVHEQIGRERIWQRVLELTGELRRRVAPFGWLEPFCDGDRSLWSGVTGFRLPEGIDPARLTRFLWERFRIEAPAWELPIGRCLRISTHFYNSAEELERLADALRAFETLGS